MENWIRVALTFKASVLLQEKTTARAKRSKSLLFIAMAKHSMRSSN
jgi:hypothetical protein